jgi:hypothetical protein
MATHVKTRGTSNQTLTTTAASSRGTNHDCCLSLTDTPPLTTLQSEPPSTRPKFTPFSPSLVLAMAAKKKRAATIEQDDDKVVYKKPRGEGSDQSTLELMEAILGSMLCDPDLDMVNEQRTETLQSLLPVSPAWT